jgi:hypothetical protein
MKFVTTLSLPVPPFMDVSILTLSIIIQLPIMMMELVLMIKFQDVPIQLLTIIMSLLPLMMDLVPLTLGVLITMVNVTMLNILSTKMMVTPSVLGKVPLMPLWS